MRKRLLCSNVSTLLSMIVAKGTRKMANMKLAVPFTYVPNDHHKQSRLYK